MNSDLANNLGWFKFCNKCKTEKLTSEFYKQSMTKDGLQNECIGCRKKRYNKDYPKQKDKANSTAIEWYNKNKNRARTQRRKNSITPQAKTIRYYKDKFKILLLVNSKSAEQLLGYSQKQLKEHLESQFYSGMDWVNYKQLWNISMIIPAKRFDLTKKENCLKAFHYSNFAPILKTESRKIKFNQ